MQIEFYLPLPTLSGFIGFAIIYYMLGLMVVAGYRVYSDVKSDWDGKQAGNTEPIKEIVIITLLSLILPLVIWAFWYQSK